MCHESCGAQSLFVTASKLILLHLKYATIVKVGGGSGGSGEEGRDWSKW